MNMVKVDKAFTVHSMHATTSKLIYTVQPGLNPHFVTYTARVLGSFKERDVRV